MKTQTLIEINKKVSQYGGTCGVRDESLIDSALGRGEMAEQYGHDRIGSVFESLVKNHPFIDGNKRTAVVYLIYSLNEVGLMYNCDHFYLSKIVDNIAANKINVIDAMNLIYDNSNQSNQNLTIDDVLNLSLVKNTLDILARKDSNELSTEEENWFDK